MQVGCGFCDAPATVCQEVALGGGYGQQVNGLAFYYACDEHGGTWTVGALTDMARCVKVRRLAEKAQGEE